VSVSSRVAEVAVKALFAWSKASCPRPGVPELLDLNVKLGDVGSQPKLQRGEEVVMSGPSLYVPGLVVNLEEMHPRD
jgi:hypothetical protein